MIQFYGAPMSSAARTHLMLEEVGVPYQFHKITLRDAAAKTEFQKINPSGRVPFIVDGDTRLQESCAINFYLAEKYKPEMMPANLVDRARVYEWSFWAMTNLQKEALAVMFSMMRPAEAPPNIEQSKATAKSLCDEIEAAFTGDYLVGNTYTVADVIVGSVVNLVQRVNAATLGPKTAAWVERLRGRDAWKKVAAQN